MTIITKAPTTRTLTLIALCLAMGVLLLRAIDSFSGPQNHTAASPIEQSLTNLVDPITGSENIRIAVHGETNRAILVLLNQDTITLEQQAQVELIIKAATGFNPQIDSLTMTQFQFANGHGANLSPLQVFELMGLGLACLCLMAIALIPGQPDIAAQTVRRPPLPAPDQPRQVRALPATTSDDIGHAAKLASDDPSGTAQLIRKWMDEGGHA